MGTKGIVSALCQKYDTRDPFEIARQRKIIVQFEPLGGVYGYYSKSFRQQFIHINPGLDEQQTLFTACHELAHALLHTDQNTPFLRASTMFSVDKLEMQANKFAVHLAFSDAQLQEFLSRSITDAADYMGVCVQLAEYRMSSVRPSAEAVAIAAAQCV